MLLSALFISPENIPKYGTEAQKYKMSYCVKKYTYLEQVTVDNISNIMRDCLDKDMNNNEVEEKKLQNKELQDFIRKTNDKQ